METEEKLAAVASTPVGATARRMACRGLHLGHRVDTRLIESTRVLAVRPLAVRVGASGYAVLFRFGIVVLFDVSPVEEAEFRRVVADWVERPYEKPRIEELDIFLESGQVETVTAAGDVMLAEITPPRLQVIAEALAKSLILEHYETRLAAVFERLEPVAEQLQARGHSRHNVRALLRQTGEVLMTRQLMVGRVEVAEKPDVLWENPGLEDLYARLAREFELQERDRALDRKLGLVSDTAMTLIDLVNSKQTLRVEWYIVILIVVEILLTLYDFFLR